MADETAGHVDDQGGRARDNNDKYLSVEPLSARATDRARAIRDGPVKDFRGHFAWIGANLGGTLGDKLTYSELVKYMQGFDDATNVLDGFHEFLVAELGGGRSLYWSSLVVHHALGTEPVHHSSDLPADFHERVANSERHLINHLFRLIDEFLAGKGM